MAIQKNSKKAIPEKKEVKWIQNLLATVKNETVQFIVGLLCVMVAVYMALAFTSFLLNGGADQSAIEQIATAQGTYTESVQNATGQSGAHIAQRLINHSFGLSSYSIATFLAVLGLALMRIRKFDLKHWFICCATALIWGSLFLSVTIDSWFSTSAIYWGGHHGHAVATWLNGQFGMPGIIILLAITAILFSIYISANTIEFIRSLFHIKLPGKDEKEEGIIPPHRRRAPRTSSSPSRRSPPRSSGTSPRPRRSPPKPMRWRWKSPTPPPQTRSHRWNP